MATTSMELIKVIQSKQDELSLRQYAIRLGVSAAYLSDVYRGKREIGPKLLKAFGYRRVKTLSITYFKSGKGTV